MTTLSPHSVHWLLTWWELRACRLQWEKNEWDRGLGEPLADVSPQRLPEPLSDEMMMWEGEAWGVSLVRGRGVG